MAKIMEKYKCPTCQEDLHFIYNSRMDEQAERIPICQKCKTAYRDPELGWKIMEELNSNAK